MGIRIENKIRIKKWQLHLNQHITALPAALLDPPSPHPCQFTIQRIRTPLPPSSLELANILAV